MPARSLALLLFPLQSLLPVARAVRLLSNSPAPEAGRVAARVPAPE
ncbi:MAG TPA: hypothetical protein VGC64_08800 [Pyrinomonadaceae bacterium]